MQPREPDEPTGAEQRHHGDQVVPPLCRPPPARPQATQRRAGAADSPPPGPLTTPLHPPLGYIVTRTCPA